MKLYDYYRSSCCYRVRIALNIKALHYEKIPIHLVNQGGEQHLPAYRAVNPQGLVPALEIDGKILTQSLAIIEYLEEKYPSPPLLPVNPYERAEVRSLALLIACETHPINNLRILQYLKNELHTSEEQTMNWYHHWLKEGFDAFERQLANLPRSLSVCYGNALSLADICLIPQVYNAKRFNFSLEKYPLIRDINDYCLTLSDFEMAAPEACSK